MENTAEKRTMVVIAKETIESLIDFIDRKGNTMTIADVAHVNETIDGLIERLEDYEGYFTNKFYVVECLKNMRQIMREVPYFNIVSVMFGELSDIVIYLK